jgi:EAL domain-containing protein (putative c-di-GMP-specific phosphodiesterase class I)
LQLRQRNFVDQLLAGAERASEYAGGIDIEITESMLMQDLQLSVRKLSQLREAGIGVAIDDFGTGYSSLCLLATLPVDTLKIDRSFVQTMLDSPNGRTLVSSIVSLGRAYNTRTVAEGVETAEQLHALEAIKCHQAQGYLLGRPGPATEVPAVISRLTPKSAAALPAKPVHWVTPKQSTSR